MIHGRRTRFVRGGLGRVGYGRPWLSLAAAVTASAMPLGVVAMSGLFRISADPTLSASSAVAPLSAGSFSLAPCPLTRSSTVTH